MIPDDNEPERQTGCRRCRGGDNVTVSALGHPAAHPYPSAATEPRGQVLEFRRPWEPSAKARAEMGRLGLKP